jgi:hypothetical protein
MRRRLDRVAELLQQQALEEDRRQEEEVAAWLATLSDEELDAVAIAAQALSDEEAARGHS